MGLSNKQIIIRHPIGETTLYRHRREAVDVLARELMTREKLLCGSSNLIDSLE